MSIITVWKKVSIITVWKKALRCTNAERNTWEFVIIEATCDEDKLLKFPECGGKCRVPEVTVVSITEARWWHRRRSAAIRDNWLVNKEYRTGEVISWYNHWTVWEVGKTVKSDYWFPKYNDTQCHSGIHVFLTREEAENYNF